MDDSPDAYTKDLYSKSQCFLSIYLLFQRAKEEETEIKRGRDVFHLLFYPANASETHQNWEIGTQPGSTTT